MRPRWLNSGLTVEWNSWDLYFSQVAVGPLLRNRHGQTDGLRLTHSAVSHLADNGAPEVINNHSRTMTISGSGRLKELQT